MKVRQEQGPYGRQFVSAGLHADLKLLEGQTCVDHYGLTVTAEDVAVAAAA
jgi:hypothetical protein